MLVSSSGLRLVAGLFLLLALGGPLAAQGARRGQVELPAQRPGVVDTYVLAFGLWGPQSVFESEAKGAAKVLREKLGARGAAVRFNGKRRFGALPKDLIETVKAVRGVIDPAEDVVVLVLTSHGTPEGVALVAGREERLVRPEDVRRLLDETGAGYRVLIVSACYSGIFAQALADERTLVITAAAADKPSFGCQDGATWTYFGDAFFNRALRQEKALDAAFAKAKDFVTAREKRDGFDPSNPQIAGGAEVLARLPR